MNKLNIMFLCLMMMAFTLYAERVSLTYKVTDEDGNPIEGVRVETIVETEKSLSKWYGSPQYDRYVQRTDSNGMATSTIKCQDGDFTVCLRAEGYYAEGSSTNRFASSYDMKLNRYVFVEKEKTLCYVLRKIKNPVEMKITHSLKWRIPLKEGIYPFDLEVGDWVTPRGKGRTADLEILYTQAAITESNKMCRGVLRFPNGGAYVKVKSPSRSFQSDYEANTNGVFVSEFPFEYNFDKTGGSRHIRGNILGDSEYLVFRIREQRDREGKVISANYGKLYGRLKTFGCLYYDKGFFNPTPNDPNIEEKR